MTLLNIQNRLVHVPTRIRAVAGRTVGCSTATRRTHDSTAEEGLCVLVGVSVRSCFSSR